MNPIVLIELARIRRQALDEEYKNIYLQRFHTSISLRKNTSCEERGNDKKSYFMNFLNLCAVKRAI
jgi:hypothetical protein